MISGRGQKPFVDQLILGDTLGAAGPRSDGWLAMITTGTAGMSFFDSVEVDEIRHPILVWQRRLLRDTEGAGQFRGAPSSLVEFSARGQSINVVYQSDGTIYPPQGVRGGGASAPARNYVTRRDGRIEKADGWASLILDAGDSITGVSPGGGGYGPALCRDPSRVREDVLEGYISSERARGVYGVVLAPDNKIDIESTAHLRHQHEQERK